MKLTALAVLAFLISTEASGQLAPNAPTDQPMHLGDAQTSVFEKAITPYVAKARETHPAAKTKYLAGLPRGETFFVTKRLLGTKGQSEQVFVRVSRIEGNKVTGKISSQLQLVTGYTPGQEYSFTESELIDSRIAKPDGSEESNVVGNFLYAYRP